MRVEFGFKSRIRQGGKKVDNHLPNNAMATTTMHTAMATTTTHNAMATTTTQRTMQWLQQQ